MQTQSGVKRFLKLLQQTKADPSCFAIVVMMAQLHFFKAPGQKVNLGRIHLCFREVKYLASTAQY